MAGYPLRREARPEMAYPGIVFRPGSRGWLPRFLRAPAECVHLEADQSWMAALAPDVLFLRGKPARRGNRTDPRPEVSLCRSCLLSILRAELSPFSGRVAAFEPDPERFSQYFFVDAEDFDAAGLEPRVGSVIRGRLAGLGKAACENAAGCPRSATWLWLSREDVSSLDDVGQIAQASGQRLCAHHGVERLCRNFARIPQANVLYMNVPYGEAGAYVWI